MLLVKNAMQVGDLHIHPQATLLEAAKLMMERNVDALPVVENEKLLGVIRLADLLTAPIPARHAPRADERRDAAQLLEIWRSLDVRHMMNDQALSVSEDTPLMKAAALLINNGRQRLPVTRADKVVGIITRNDIVRTLLMAKQV